MINQLKKGSEWTGVAMLATAAMSGQFDLLSSNYEMGAWGTAAAAAIARVGVWFKERNSPEASFLAGMTQAVLYKKSAGDDQQKLDIAREMAQLEWESFFPESLPKDPVSDMATPSK